jgi:hypothetical protein
MAIHSASQLLPPIFKLVTLPQIRLRTYFIPIHAADPLRKPAIFAGCPLSETAILYNKQEP